ncbi:type III-B CRISPR module-associated protein Cmr5 [Candidatus Kryptobacter tengchongensis]|uniref:CRISPR type III-B/RAMP module-associated protein Cmr5 n=1 Tax=Kryptobacter tengchongensis TaxID=1643429 RepID=A0A916PBY4_KRYT1|nr:type III-B CRISPR module-associated protein Cmr5 [Candidatus Kryptobacter tengchongensis]CUT01625.1 CRISPR-associated protein Cmr5 [Candidatus Kryptobacter tengchongensis]
MPENEALITKLEKGRAEFAYRCALEGKSILQKIEINGEFYEDDKYKSYVKKIPSMILTNGLGQTLAFICAKRKKEKDKKKPGSEGNPKNAYDLIYKQLTDYLKSDSTARIRMPENQNELIEWVISLDSYNYRYVTEEVLAFLNWLRKFAEGMIETEEGGGE